VSQFAEQEPFLMSRTKFLARVGAVSAAATLAVLAAAGTAAAHVSATASAPAKKGGYTKITFRVPDEDPTAGTTKLEIAIPAEYRLTSVRTKPVPGWTAEVKKVKVNDTEVTVGVVWTAGPGTRIGPGEFGEFDISAGPLPTDVDTLVIPATQTYDSGKVVAWDAPPASDGSEPQHPAPTVPLVDAAPDSDHGGAVAGGHTDEHAQVVGQDQTARWLGGAGLVAGALGLGFGLGTTLRTRKKAATTTKTGGTTV
jgi:uncharacterized protein YcnI